MQYWKIDGREYWAVVPPGRTAVGPVGWNYYLICNCQMKICSLQASLIYPAIISLSIYLTLGNQQVTYRVTELWLPKTSLPNPMG